MGERDPKRCRAARLGGSIGGFIASLPVGIEVGGRIGGLLGKDVVEWGTFIGAAIFVIVGSLGGSRLAWASASACDADLGGPPPEGPGMPARSVPKKKAATIYIVILLSSVLILFWPASLRSFLTDVIVGAVWVGGTVWEYTSAARILANRKLVPRLARA
jgi:hypothetical protein